MKHLYRKQFNFLEEAQEEVKRLTALGLNKARVVIVNKEQTPDG